jgi:hypothetical protein
VEISVEGEHRVACWLYEDQLEETGELA